MGTMKIWDGTTWQLVAQNGPAGPVVLPVGGSAGQVLAKKSGADYDTAWRSTLWEEWFFLDPFITVGPAGGANGYDVTITVPFNGSLVVDAIVKVAPTAGGGGVNTAEVRVEQAAGFAAPTNTRSSWYSAYQFATANVPVKAQWNAVSAGSFKFKFTITTQPAAGMTIAMRDVFGTLRFIPS